MNIEIYKNGETNPIIISNWGELAEYIPADTTFFNFVDTFEIWDPINRRPIEHDAVWETLHEIANLKNQLNELIYKEF